MEFTPEDQGNHKMIRRTFYFLDQKDVIRNDLDTYGKVVPGLLKVRSVKSLSNGFVQFRNITCYCASCINGNFDDCFNTSRVDKWETKHIRKEAGCCTPKDPCQFQDIIQVRFFDYLMFSF